MVTRKSCGCLVNEYDEVIEVCPDHWYWFRTFGELANKLGEPFKNGESGFPDDDDKVDVCWCFTFEGGYVSIWNYKNGPAYCGDEIQSLQDIDYFSFDYTDDDTLKAFSQQYDLSLTV